MMMMMMKMMIVFASFPFCSVFLCFYPSLLCIFLFILLLFALLLAFLSTSTSSAPLSSANNNPGLLSGHPGMMRDGEGNVLDGSAVLVTQESLMNELVKMITEVEHKDQDLKVAAELGKMLLEKDAANTKQASGATNPKEGRKEGKEEKVLSSCPFLSLILLSL